MKNFCIYGVEVGNISDQSLVALIENISNTSTLNPFKRTKLRLLKDKAIEELEYRKMIRIAVRDFENDGIAFLFK